MFDEADTDGSGVVDANELEAALTAAGFTPDVVKALKGEFTRHPDVKGTVTKAEFIGFGKDMYDHARAQGLSDAEMQKEWENFDPSKVTVADLKAARQHLREHGKYGAGL